MSEEKKRYIDISLYSIVERTHCEICHSEHRSNYPYLVKVIRISDEEKIQEIFAVIAE